MAHPSKSGSRRGQRIADSGQRGFTLAGLMVIMTIMMIFVAYTVPRQWSTIMQRERDRQTIFIMKQYARAISDFNDRNKSWPVNIDQIKKAKQPRFLRGKDAEYIDPLTGQVDWMIIPQAAAGATGTVIPGTSGSTSTTGTQGQQPVATIPAIPMKDYAGGPFIGVRPAKTGQSFLELNGVQNYEQWSYTALDYRLERDARRAAAAKLWQ